jgi:dTDP-4-dehydrorhamnose reductase
VYDAQEGSSGPFPENLASVYNTYGFSKIAAEFAALQVRACALRTNFFGKSERSGRLSFSDWLYQALSNTQQINVFEDVLFSPLGMPTLVQQLANIVQQQPIGVFNLGSREGLSKADFAFAFAEAAGLPTDSMTRATSSASTQIQAYRPKDMRMDSSQLEALLGVTLPTLREEIQQCGRTYRESA